MEIQNDTKGMTNLRFLHLLQIIEAPELQYPDRTDLFEDEKVKDNHAEVVHNKGLSELERLPITHKLWP